MEAEHFIMLDQLDTVRGSEFDRNYPKVQIVYPANDNSSLESEGNGIHLENRLTYRERKKHLFTISLNVNADY